MKYYNTFGETFDLAVFMPNIQAYDLELDGTNILLSRGNGIKYVAIVSQSPITELPYDGVTYSLGYAFSDGSYVIAKGVATTIDVSDLAAGDWYIRIFEYNGFAGIEKYNRNTAVDNPLQFTIVTEDVFDDTFDDTFE